MHNPSQSAVLPFLQNTCAIVVTYYPDAGFRDRLERVLAQFPFVIVVDNGSQGVAAEMLHGLKDGRQVLLAVNNANLGVAVALNQGVALALQQGFEWGVLLDQDTLVFPDMLESLLAAHIECGGGNALVGGNYHDVHRNRNFIECKNNGQGYKKRKTLITSGTLASLDLVTRIGGFREDYFIDSVDHEFCLRARSHGCTVVITCKPVMSHSIGAPMESAGWLSKFTSFNHSPARKYYIARNTIATAKSYLIHEPAWAMRQVWRLIFDFCSIWFFEAEKPKKAMAFLMGITHGLVGKMGSIDKAWPNGGR
jgi:rhamnosyltransferase